MTVYDDLLRKPNISHRELDELLASLCSVKPYARVVDSTTELVIPVAEGKDIVVKLEDEYALRLSDDLVRFAISNLGRALLERDNN